jgi:hypothetical protein
MTGGEPTTYPRFAELCELLTATHYLSFNSNLTHSAIVDVAKRVDPSRISFINAGLHAEERELRQGLAKFLKHVAYLKGQNFPVFISIVSTPDVSLLAKESVTRSPIWLRHGEAWLSLPRAAQHTSMAIALDWSAKCRHARTEMSCNEVVESRRISGRPS